MLSSFIIIKYAAIIDLKYKINEIMIKKSFSVIILLVVSFVVVAKEKDIICTPTDSCSCKMSNSGKLVSLWDINDPNNPRYGVIYSYF